MARQIGFRDLGFAELRHGRRDERGNRDESRRNAQGENRGNKPQGEQKQAQPQPQQQKPPRGDKPPQQPKQDKPQQQAQKQLEKLLGGGN